MISDYIRVSQEYMDQLDLLDGWLIYDYHDINPVFRIVLNLEAKFLTRPCFYYIPKAGDPTLVIHHVDAGQMVSTGLDIEIYSDRASMVTALYKLLRRSETIAMEYSPMGFLPRCSKVDAGTIELIKSLGPQVISSAGLVQHVTGRWDPEQLGSHKQTADRLGVIVLDAFRYIGEEGTGTLTEYDVSEFIRDRFRQEKLVTSDGPVVAINAHSSDPHYVADHRCKDLIRSGDWVLIDLWAKQQKKESVYADITWVAFFGNEVPTLNQQVFEIVVGARNAAFEYIWKLFRHNKLIKGLDVDRIARQYISERGYGDYFIHRLGHSIDQEVHGNSVNLDGFETEDTRNIIPGICLSIEPGIYLPEFGVRSEIDFFMSTDGPIITTPVQNEIVLIPG